MYPQLAFSNCEHSFLKRPFLYFMFNCNGTFPYWVGYIQDRFLLCVLFVFFFFIFDQAQGDGLDPTKLSLTPPHQCAPVLSQECFGHWCVLVLLYILFKIRYLDIFAVPLGLIALFVFWGHPELAACKWVIPAPLKFMWLALDFLLLYIQ